MERVGAALRKSPPSDLDFACFVMQTEKAAFMDNAPRYAAEHAAFKKDGNAAIPFVLASIATRCAEQILDHEIELKKTKNPALVDELMKMIDAGKPAEVQNGSKPETLST